MSRTASAENGDYRIEVTDFGPIAHADVDLRPLTVFAGPSNTGKSYLAMLVYALHRSFGSSQRPGFRFSPYPFRIADSVVYSLSDRETLAARIGEWMATVGSTDWKPLPDDLAEPLRRALERPRTAARSLPQEVSRCFGADELADLVRRESVRHATRIMVSIPSAGSEPVRYRFEFGQAGERFSGQVPAVPLYVSQPDEDLSSYEDDQFLVHEMLGAAVRRLIGPIVRSAYYLPADRTGVMHSHQVVVSTLIQSAATAGLRPSTNVPMLSGVLADFLDGLIRMSSGPRRRAVKMSQILEKNLFSGTVRLQPSETGYPSFAYRPAGWDTDLPLMRTSSMVSELAPVVLYLRYFVRPGDVLIIEEPESHLHPAMQAVFARELARLVRSGVRVMLTTHSEWILEALANLVRLAELSESERKGITGSDVALTSDQVGAWMFTPNADGAGSTVTEIPMDTEAGSFPAGYGEITESLYNDWARISNRIEELRSDGA